MGEQETAPRGRHAPPLEVRQDRQRARLYAAASAVFARAGFADATAEAIAREAGMSKATFYEHFGNKEECLLSLFDAAIDVVVDGIAQAAQDHGGETPQGRVGASVRAFLDVVDAFPDQAQTLLVEIIGAGPRAAERRDAALTRVADYMYEANRADAEAGQVHRLAARRVRDRRRDRRARVAPAAHQGSRGHARARAGARAAGPRHRGRDPTARERGLSTELDALEAEITACRACPRLVEWRERVAREKRASFREWDYWGRPIPGFGDPAARVLILGLAPAAHGANRTGRVFTGDRSGDFLFAALHRNGFANQPTSEHRDDGLELRDCWITAAVRCAPPANKPLPVERERCSAWLERELELIAWPRVVVCLGAFAWEAALRTPALLDGPVPKPRPKFGHGAEHGRLLGCFHPSQQNTFTGVLTPEMMDGILARARELAS
jgi:uracil-DNA glycosylase